ncbi:MAG: class I SAM-dependent methyltransferase [Candidatus Thorarchaeota archaeon]
MTSSEEMMAHIMSQEYRQRYLREVADLVPSDALLVLDAGCGVGAAMALINQHAASTKVIGLDLSRHMLTHQVKDVSRHDLSLVQGFMPEFPFGYESFDAVVAVQSLSEVLCFVGEEVLLDTLEEIHSLLSERGVLVVLDHQSPGIEPLEVNLNKQMLQRLRQFHGLFEYRPFNFEVLDDGWVRITMCDFYEFITKIWSFGTNLEKEEMQETHTPFTGKEFSDILRNHGFVIDLVFGTVPFENYLRRYKVKIRPKQHLPDRFFIVRATKQK